MSMSRAHLKRIEEKYGKDDRFVQLARQQLAGEHARSAQALYITGSVKTLPKKKAKKSAR